MTPATLKAPPGMKHISKGPRIFSAVYQQVLTCDETGLSAAKIRT
jgi:hypothetical protein